MHFKLLLIVLSFFFSQVLLAQVSGKVLDKSRNEPVKGATIVIDGSSRGAISESDGSFRLAIDQKKSAVIKITAIGFKAGAVQFIPSNYFVDSGLVIYMEPVTQQMEGVVVSAKTRTTASVASLYQTQKNAMSISDGISADIIRKTPDRTMGDVLKRVTGTTIQDNKFVIIRGLSDRYNFALSDGSILPSTEPNRKAFSFDIIPASMIDNIIITKAGTPDLPADFAGGVINIITKEVPTRDYNNISIGAGYNTSSTFKNFRNGYKSNTDFLGFDDGSRQLPKDFPSRTKIVQGLTADESIKALSMLTNDYRIRTRSALPAINFQADMARVRLYNNGSKFGFTASITYNHSENIKPNIKREYDSYAYTDNVYNYSSNIGGLLNFAYQKGKNKYALKSLYNRIFNDNFLEREGVDLSFTKDMRYYAYDLLQKSLIKTSFVGSNGFSRNIVLDYNLTFNLITNNQPDQRKVTYTRYMGDVSKPYEAQIMSNDKYNARMFGNLNEKIYSARADLTIPVSFFNAASSVKVGGSFLNRHRDFENRYIGAVLKVMPGTMDIIQNDIGQIFTANNIAKGFFKIEDNTLTSDTYKADASNIAGYAMMDTRFLDKWRLVWGARFEHYTLKINAGKVFTKNWDDILPSANLTFSINPKANLRASYFRSLARPEFREITPLLYYDYERQLDISGNENLNRSIIDNIDLKYEFFPKSGELFSVGVFYKQFKNTLEMVTSKPSSATMLRTNNFPSAKNIGIEAEIRKNLGFISDYFSLFDFYTNVAIVDSKVDVKGLYINNQEISSRPLTGQSPYTINSSLGYTSQNKKFTASVFYNTYGQRIDIVGGDLWANVYESSRNVIDAQIAHKFSEKSEIKINLRDILNEPVRFYFDRNGNKRFDNSAYQNGSFKLEGDWIYEAYKPGSSFSITYTLRF